MKKYIMLTSVLGLVACNSGGGHHSSDYYVVPEPVAPALDMPDAVQTWAPGGTSAQAQSGGNFDQDTFVFTLDNSGAITAVNLDNRNYARQGSANEYVNISGNETRVLNLETLGKKAGLQYADFGYAQKTTQTGLASTDRDVYVFTGGDATRKIDTQTIKDATYTGVAVAYVEAEMSDRIVNQVSETSDAKLVVDANGGHTMSMNFSKATNPWYDVEIKNGVISLSGGDNVAADFKVDGMIQDSPYAAIDAYANGTVGEVVYRAGAEYKDNITGREVEFDAAFGGVKQQLN